MEKMTRNDVKQQAAYGNIYYTDMNVSSLKYFNKIGYNSGVYGWNYDVYEYGLSVLLVGYRVPSFATYIDPEEVEKAAIKRLQEKIENIDSTKERLILELQELTNKKQK